MQPWLAKLSHNFLHHSNNKPKKIIPSFYGGCEGAEAVNICGFI